MGETNYSKHFIALESNPLVFSRLIHRLGVSSDFTFQDVLSLDDPALMPPRPALALVLAFPTSPAYEERRAKEEASRHEYTGSGQEEAVVWFKQTINNACGLYSALHAVSNVAAPSAIAPHSLLAKLFESCLPLQPRDRARVLENSAELEAVYKTVALHGDSAAPMRAEDEVDFHFVCFVKSPKTGRVYELDGDRKGPVDRGFVVARDEDMLAEGGLRMVKELMQREDSLHFSLMALVQNVVQTPLVYRKPAPIPYGTVQEMHDLHITSSYSSARDRSELSGP